MRLKLQLKLISNGSTIKIGHKNTQRKKCILSRYSTCPFSVPSVQILEDMGVGLGDTSFKISSVQRQVFTVMR